MPLFDSLSYFSPGFADRVADPVELGRQLYDHRMEAKHVHDAIIEIGEYAQFRARAHKLTPAAKTLAGETAIEWLFAVGGRASWGEFSLTVRRAHKMAGARNDRVLQKLEDAGVIVCTYHGRGDDRFVTVALSYDLWLPAAIFDPELVKPPATTSEAIERAARTTEPPRSISETVARMRRSHDLMRAENTGQTVAGITPAAATRELDEREASSRRRSAGQLRGLDYRIGDDEKPRNVYTGAELEL